MIEKVIELYKEKTAKECYKFEVEENVTPGIMDNKIGGVPYLPVGEEVPLDMEGNPMMLLVQINLENIELEDYPRKGILEIFVDKELTYPCDYKVKYFEEITDYRKDLPPFDTDNYSIPTPLKINLVKDIEHMPMSDDSWFDTLAEVIKEVSGKEITNYGEIEDFFTENGTEMWKEFEKINNFPGNIGGYADYTQSDPRPFKNAPDKTECLIKIDSNIRHGVMIGDAGIIFSFVSKEDIKNKNFENAIVDWDCC